MFKSIRNKIAHKILIIANYIHSGSDIFPSIQYLRTMKWKKNYDPNHLRHHYQLDKNSIVFDLGGYKGDWTAKIFDKYKCNIFVFEPMKQYYINIESRFKSSPKIKVYNFGIGDKDEIAYLSIDEESSSIFGSGHKEEIQIREASQFIHKNKVEEIHLIKINIEGAEYNLLEHLLESNIIHKFKNIQIQFHDFVPNALKRMVNIQNKLSKTHSLTYSQDFVWENWKIQEDINA